MINNILLILSACFFVVLAGLFAGAETGVYRLSRLRLRLGIEKRHLPFIILGKLFKQSRTLLISILIGTNLAHYAATSIITYILLSSIKTEHAAELIATAIIAPVLFVFSELIPKNIFFYRSAALLPWTAPVLFAFHKLFRWCGIIPLLEFLSHAFARIIALPSPSRSTIPAVRSSFIKAVVQETHEEAFLSSVQTDLINHLANISELSIKSVMTPINKVQMTDVKSDKTALLEILKESPFTRLVAYKDRPANIIGFINIYQALSPEGQFTSLDNFIKPIRNLSADTPITVAISIMQKENRKIVLVTSPKHPEQKKPLGIITMKDLVEELLGELAEW